MTDTDNRIREMDQFMASMDNRLRVVESIINEDNAKDLAETVEFLKIVVRGDHNLGIVPIMERIQEIVRRVEKIYDHHNNMRFIVSALVIFDFITLISLILIVMSIR